MKKRKKNIYILALFFIFLFGVFSLEVKALDEESEINNDILNNYSDSIKFLDDDIALVMGSLRNDLFLSDVIKQIDIDGLVEDYNIYKVYVTDSDDNVLNDDSIIVSNMKLVFEVSDDYAISYNIMVVGDVNNDGVVNNDDVTNMVDSVLSDGEVSVINDINSDGYFNVLDITHTIYSITFNSWENNVISTDILTSKIDSASDVYVGDEVEVKYTISGFDKDSINGISGMLNYDKSLLELIDVTIDNQYGYINDNGNFLYILDNYNSDDVLLTLKFKAISVGEANVSINDVIAATSGIQVNMDTNSVNTNIVINDYGLGGDDDVEDNNIVDTGNKYKDIVVENSNSSVNNSSSHIQYLANISSKNTVSYVKVSSDNYIKSLKIKGYDISFDKDTLEYSITVSSDVKALDLDIILNDDNASYEVIGNEKFKSGKNVVSIKVTAEDGSIRTYTINVNKKQELTNAKKDEDKSDSSRVVIIILIVLVIIGLIYVIFKDDEEEEAENNK